MKVYKCDSCGRTIDNPYKVKMKEFYISYEYDYGIAFPYNYRKKTKIHLCENCYRGLYSLVEKVRSDNTAE